MQTAQFFPFEGLKTYSAKLQNQFLDFECFIINFRLKKEKSPAIYVLKKIRIFPSEIFLSLTKFIKMPDLLTLAAMKFYAMGRRAKWKDYIDIYFLLNNHFTIEEVSKKAKLLFEGGYSEKLFRQQLSFFEDIDYSEPVEWVQTPISDETIKVSLTNLSLTF